MNRFTVFLGAVLLPGFAGAPAAAATLGVSTCCVATGVPGCDDPACEAAICDFDAFCCDEEWDETCAESALAVCEVCAPDTGSCCAPTGVPGCDDPDCEAEICDFDSFCCDEEWDGACAEAALALCGVCTADIDGDGDVDIVDLLLLLAAFGPCPAPPAPCPADTDDDGDVDIVDLLALLAAFGA